MASSQVGQFIPDGLGQGIPGNHPHQAGRGPGTRLRR
jgi:hypothetical protein